jgi:hypothetical protein
MRYLIHHLKAMSGLARNRCTYHLLNISIFEEWVQEVGGGVVMVFSHESRNIYGFDGEQKTYIILFVELLKDFTRILTC